MKKTAVLGKQSQKDLIILRFLFKTLGMSSNFYHPLTGKEHTERLDVLFQDLLESEDEEATTSPPKSGKGKVSQWVIDGEPSTTATSPWLHSPSKSKEKTVKRHVQARQRPGKKQCKKIAQTSPSPRRAEKEMSSSSVVSNPVKDINPKSIQPNGDEDISTRIKKLVGDISSSDSEQEDRTEILNDEKCKQRRTELYSGFGTASSGFSVEDTEKPKLSVKPSAAKVDFLLSKQGDEPVVKIPACMNQYLRDYQRDGIRFLYQHFSENKGAILGDDMGLGKTIQVIGFISALLGKQGNHKDAQHNLPKFIKELSDDIDDSPPRRATKPFLIVAPSCVMMNWLEEFNTWGYFTTQKFHGSDKETCLADVKKDKVEIVVTTFETFRDNCDRLCIIDWEAVIVDEVHKIKEPKAQITQALNEITTRCRYGLTGTALQNNMVDLWSILDWAQPGVLGPLDKFNEKFTLIIQLGQRHDASKRDLAKARKQKDKFAQIRKKILLRRTKALIADQMPSKEDLVVMSRLTDFQVAVYKAILSHSLMGQVMKAEDPCDCGKKKMKASCCYKYTRTKEGKKIKVWSLVLSCMHLLLKAANHCALLIPDDSGKTSPWQAKYAQEVCEQALKDFPQFMEEAREAAFLTLSDPKYCGKMKILQGLLSIFASAHDKVLVFSYSTRLLDIIEKYIIAQCYEYRRIDGKTSSMKRLEIVHQFNKDKDIFICLISTKAGGLGLNLTGANRVVIFDPNWNPSHDLQAQDRAYRIGQTRNVKVYRLVSAGTIEENMYLRQVYKQQLDEVAVSTNNAKRYFHGIQGDRWTRGELFGVKNMFSLRNSDTCLTMDILNRNERLEKELAGYDITRYIPPVDSESTVDDSISNNASDVDDDNGGNVHCDDIEEKDEKDFFETLFRDVKESDNETNNSSLTSFTATSNHLPSNANVNDSDDDSDGDFFLPKIHSRSSDTPTAANTKPKKSPIKDLFTVDEITFPGTSFHTGKVVDNTQEHGKRRKQIGKSWKPSPGLSWLFTGSDSSSGDQSGEDDEIDKDVKEKDYDNDRTECDVLADQGSGLLADYKASESSTSAAALSRLFFDTDDDEEENGSNHPLKHDTIMNNEVVKMEKDNERQQTEKAKGKSHSSKISTSHQAVVKNVRQVKTRTAKSKAAKVVAPTLDYDAVNAVFEECGVLHTHGNKEVIGSSRAEDHMTNCAMKDVYLSKTNAQMPAMQCDPLPKEEEKEVKTKKRKGTKEPPDHNAPTSVKKGSVKILMGQTPPGIQRQMWKDFCKFSGEDQLALAERLASCETEERLKFLHDFFSHKHQNLKETLNDLLRIKSADELDTSKRKKETPQTETEKERTPSTRKSLIEKERRETNSSKSKSKTASSKTHKTRRRAPPNSLFMNPTLQDSESQDSLTAKSPFDILPSPEDDTNSYTPVPPKGRPKFPIPSPSKSAKIQARQKALNKVARNKLFDKSTKINNKGVLYNENEEDGETSLINDYMSMNCDNVNEVSMNTVSDILHTNVYITQNVDEDIPSLLHEMGKPSFRKQNDNEDERSLSILPSISDSSCRIKHSPCITKLDDKITSTSLSYHTKPFSNNKNSDQRNKFLVKRNYESLLDDIFDIENPKNDESESVSHLYGAEITNVDKKQKDIDDGKKKSKTVLEDERPSTSFGNNQIKEVTANQEMCLSSDEDIVANSDVEDSDCMFLNSTLKSESPKRPRRRRNDMTSPKKVKTKLSSPVSRKLVLDKSDEVDGSQSLF